MSVTVTNLSGGAAFVAMNSKNIQFESDCSLEMVPTTSVLSSALYGKFDEIPTDLLIKFSGTPRYYDTAAIPAMFPYTGSFPAAGTFYGGGNAAASINSINGDQFILNNAMVGKMPDLILGMEKVILGPMEIWGLIQSGQGPANSAAYYTYNAAGGSYSFAYPAVPGTAVIGQQEYTAAFGSVSGLANFQAQETWTISHELEWSPVPIQGRTRAFRLLGYRALAKCKPADATMAALLTALGLQGANATPGTRLSQLAKAANGGASFPSLAITGVSNISVTLGNAALKTAGFMFGSKPLRQGEIGFVTTADLSSGAPAVPLTLA
jgi:hypothetical protein